ncbi:MAG: sugar transferase, partial [Myxococcales bacterium]
MLRSLRLLTPLLLIVDVSLAAASLLVADLLRKNVRWGMPLAEGTGWLSATVVFVAVASWLAALLVVDAHDARRLAKGGSWSRLFVANCLGVLFFVSGLFFLKIGDFSRLLVGYFFLATLTGLTMRHAATTLVLERAMQPFARRVLLIGGGDVGLEVMRRLELRPVGMQLVGAIAADGELEGAPTLGTIDELASVVRANGIDEIIIALPGENHPLIEKVILELQAEPVRIHLVPDILELAMIRARVEDFLGIPLVGLREPPIDDIGRLVKRVFDLVAGGLITLVAAPVMLVCGLLIKLHDGGPVFFRQRRIGENGLPFEMLKFRSMVTDAEKRLKEVGIDLEKLDGENPV